MRSLVLLSLSVLLTGCCQTRVAERHCGTQRGCQTARPGASTCGTSRNPCGMRSRDPRCSPPRGYVCRSSLTIDWKPLKYPVLRRRKTHEICAAEKQRCRTGCLTDGLTDGLIVPSEPASHGSTPFGDAPVLDPPPALNPPPSNREATIPGVGTPAPSGTGVPGGSPNAASAASAGPVWNPQTGVPEIRDASTVRRFSSETARSIPDQRMAIEMWPHSPQYTGRR